MRMQILVKLLAFFFMTLLAISLCTMVESGKEEMKKSNMMVPNFDEAYCRDVECKGMKCKRVYSAEERCYCVIGLRGPNPQVAIPCIGEL
ncbi:unnamed protein product [Linum trigynum]|uniref:Uncharacterized protein n=1 Tax=Linum trigynum TaxID=586398 RepID=A0AAV2CKN1_9ROSI